MYEYEAHIYEVHIRSIRSTCVNQPDRQGCADAPITPAFGPACALLLLLSLPLPCRPSSSPHRPPSPLQCPASRWRNSISARGAHLPPLLLHHGPRCTLALEPGALANPLPQSPSGRHCPRPLLCSSVRGNPNPCPRFGMYFSSFALLQEFGAERSKDEDVVQAPLPPSRTREKYRSVRSHQSLGVCGAARERPCKLGMALLRASRAGRSPRQLLLQEVTEPWFLFAYVLWPP